MYLNKLIHRNPWLQKAVWVISRLLMAVGATGFIGGGLIAMGFIDVDFELPLGHVSAITVDETEHIYLALEFYGYIQKYGPDGQFLSNWRSASASGGAFNMRYDDQRIITSTARGNRQVIYDLEGNIIEAIKDADAYDWDLKNQQAVSPAGNTYTLEGWLASKAVYKLSADGSDQKKIIEASWLRWLFCGPIPAWPLAMLGLLLSFPGMSPDDLAQMKEKAARFQV